MAQCTVSFVLKETMINLFKIKGQKREEAANAIGRGQVKKQSAGELRLNKGIFFYYYFCFCMKLNVHVSDAHYHILSAKAPTLRSHNGFLMKYLQFSSNSFFQNELNHLSSLNS
jgi:hypothetical protein